MDKREMRAAIRERAQSASFASNQSESDKILTHLRTVLFPDDYRMLAAFYPRKDEPDILPFLQEWLLSGRHLCLPVANVRPDGTPDLFFREVADLGTALHRAPLDLLEPGSSAPIVLPSEIDAVLVPGMAFDSAGGRLGRGKGFYDRFLSGRQIPVRSWIAGFTEGSALRGPTLESVFHGLTLAPVLSWQLVKQVPINGEDADMDLLVMAEGVLHPAIREHMFGSGMIPGILV